MTKKINKEDWYYWGQWMEPPLSADFWLHWGKTKAVRQLSSKTNFDVIFFNGHYYLWKESYYSLMNKSYLAAKQGNHNYFNNFIIICKKTARKILKDERYLKTKKSFSIKELKDIFDSFQELFGPWMLVFPIAEGVEKCFKEELNKSKVDFSSVVPVFQSGPQPWRNLQHREMIDFIQQLARRTSLNLLKKEIRKIADVLQRKYPVLWRAMNSHVHRFEWVRCHNFQIEPFMLEDLITEMKNELRNYPPKSFKSSKVSLPRRIKVLAQQINLLGFWRFRLAEISGRIEFYLKPKLSQIAKGLGLTYQELLWFTKNEILESLKNNKKLDEKVMEARIAGFGMIYLRGKEQVIIGKSLAIFRSLFKEKTKSEKKMIEGVIGSPGFVRGKARIVLTHQDLKKFKRGEILVAPETTPDFVPIMKKAIAFVTDIGGLTSHAAIVAREMKKPCIIATKIATKVLKDGDLIEVDTDKGIVRILEKK